ncbi:hypothetical protein Mapa_010315 [Marchantia paleacea]|nr:hypothetical protein Mapa_010315 [Marchantia paleacea]
MIPVMNLVLGASLVQGMKQKIALNRAHLHEPREVLVLDKWAIMDIGNQLLFSAHMQFSEAMSRSLTPAIRMTAGASTSELPMKTIIGIIIVRLCALPVIGMMMIKIAHDFGFLPEDPLFRFVLMVQYTMPTAMNVGPYSLTP